MINAAELGLTFSTVSCSGRYKELVAAPVAYLVECDY